MISFNQIMDQDEVHVTHIEACKHCIGEEVELRRRPSLLAHDRRGCPLICKIVCGEHDLRPFTSLLRLLSKKNCQGVENTYIFGSCKEKNTQKKIQKPKIIYHTSLRMSLLHFLAGERRQIKMHEVLINQLWSMSPMFFPLALV